MSADTKYVSVKTEDIIKQLKRNNKLKRSSKILMVRQGCWELLLLATNNINDKVDMYVIHYKGEEIDHSKSGYAIVCEKSGDIKTIFRDKLPKYLEKKAITVAKALEKEGYNSIVGR